MKIRKIIPVMLCISLILCLFTGCGGKEPDYQTVTPPADGWTKAKLLDVTYIGGNPMSRTPCWGDFRKNVSMNKKECKEEDGFVTVKLEYKDGSELCTLLYYDSISSVKEITKDLPIQMILFERSNPIASKQLCINGVRMNDSQDTVREKLGEPSMGSERAFTYYTEDKMTLFIEFYKDQVWRVSIDGLAK